MWHETRACVSLLLSLPLSCYQSSLGFARHLGAVFRTFPPPPRDEGEEEDEDVFDGVVASLAISLTFTSRPPPCARGPLRRKQEFRKRPRGREIREGCESRRPGSFRDKMQSAAILPLLYLGISRLNIATEISPDGQQNTARRSPHFQFLSPPTYRRRRRCPAFVQSTALLIVPLTYREILSKVSRPVSSPRS